MRINFGADYYPEHWEEERIVIDAKLMKEMGIDLVRMGEFSWNKMEPREGKYHFEWLDRAISILGEHGIKTMLGTPTATPPMWIVEKNPDILPIDSQGRVCSFGGRHHDCQSNEQYRIDIKRIVTAMAKHYKDNKDVVAWQIDNELGNSHQDLCHCESCKRAFQKWLKEKYITIEELNSKWGTAFWSQTYDAFEQIPTPKYNVTDHSPSLILDWKRFHSDLIVDFQNYQVDIIREICENQQISHDMMGFCPVVDYYDLADKLDYVCHNQYPMGFFDDPQPGKTPDVLASTLDFVRSFKKGGKTFWITEQQAGITGWRIMGKAPRPGQLALWTAQSIAHGADCVIFFRWRTCSFGTEEYWHGILPHSGIPGRNYYELQEVINKLSPVMGEIEGALPEAEVAILFEYDQQWAFEIQPHHPELDYTQQVNEYYRAFYEKNIPVDFINDTDQLSKYKVVVAPLQYIMNSYKEKQFKEYVQNGGQLVLTMRTGVKNEENVCMIDSHLPGQLKELLGVEVREYDCLRDFNVRAELDGKEYLCQKWCDIVTPIQAQSVATYTEEFYTGMPVVTVNNVGKGKAYYIATEPEEDFINAIIEKVIQNCQGNIGAISDEKISGVEFTRRRTKEYDYIFVLNHTDEDKVIKRSKEWETVIGNEEISGYGIACFKVKR